MILCVGCIILSLTSLLLSSSIHYTDFSIKPDTHTIVIGPSTTGCALDDSCIPGFQNLSRDGTQYDLIVPVLPRILSENPQIDTVWISFGRFHFKHVGYGSTDVTMQYLRDKMDLILYDPAQTEWGNYLTNVNFYCALFNPDLLKASRFIHFGRDRIEDYGFQFNPNDSKNLHEDEAKWGIHWYDAELEKCGGDTHCTKDWIMENYKSRDYWIRKAIDICRDNNVVPVLFFTPLYHYERWVSKDGLREYMSGYDHSILVADYEDFILPSDTLYRDVHHLNKYGAQLFSNHLYEDGVKMETVGEWVERNR